MNPLKKLGKAATKAAEKSKKGLGEKAAEAKLKTERTPRDEAMIEAAEASKRGFLGPSKEKDVWYHATHEDFSKFRPSHRGAHFFTKDPEFANEFLGIYDEGYEMKPGANIMPVHLQAQNPFDYENPEHIQSVLEKYRVPQGVSPEKVRDNLEVGNWNFIEDRNVQRAIKESGFDSFYVNEYGKKNLGVFEPTQIKSAIGMQGSYDITDPDITKAEGGAVDHKLKAWFAKGGAVTPEVLGGGTGIPMKKGGAVDQKLKDWYAAQGGFTDSYEKGLETQAKKTSDIQAYKEGKVGADALLRHFPGMTAAMIEEQLNPSMAAGGEVRMQTGGDPTAQIQAQLAAGVPVQMSRGPEGDIARKLVEAEEAKRRKEEEERRARVAGLPLSERLGGMYEAGRTIQSVLGQEIAKPFVGLISGEEKIKELEEGTPLPKSEAGIEYLTRVGEFLEPVGQAIEASKLPDVPFLPELVPVTFVPGLGKQVSRATAKAAEAIPEEVKSLPVGASTMPAEGTPPVSEVIAKPKKMEIYAPANSLGLYSPLHKAALNLKRKEATGELYLKDLKDAGVSDEELEYSGVKRMLMNSQNTKLPKETVQAWSRSNEIPFQVFRAKENSDLGDYEFSRPEIMDDEEYIRSTARDYQDEFDDFFPARREEIREEIEDQFSPDELNDPYIIRSIDEKVDEKIKEEAYQRAYEDYYNDPFYTADNEAGYTISGNDNIGYTVRDPNYRIMDTYNNFEQAEGAARQDAIDKGLLSIDSTKFDAYQLDGGDNYQEFKIQVPFDSKRYFSSSHWDEDDVMIHTRTQDRLTTDQKPMLYVDEIQSDWHQAGRDMGYFTPDDEITSSNLLDKAGKIDSELQNVKLRLRVLQDAALPEIKERIIKQTGFLGDPKTFSPSYRELMAAYEDHYPEIQELVRKKMELDNQLSDVQQQRRDLGEKPPDAPFKDKWHEIAVKAMLHQAAKDGYQRVGFSSSNPHIERWGTEQFAWEKAPKIEFNEENFRAYVKDQLPSVSDETINQSWRDQNDEVIRAFKRETERPEGWRVAAKEQAGGRAAGMNLEAEARARGLLKENRGTFIGSKESLAMLVESTLRDPTPLKVERVTNKIWNSMQKKESGIHEPRKEGMQYFYDEALPKFLQKYAKKIGAEYYESGTRVGRTISPEGGYVDKIEPVYMIEFTDKAKKSAITGQPFKKGGAVTKDHKLQAWYKEQKMAAGGKVRKVVKAAEKAGKRMSREEAEKAGFWHPISETKLAKPIGEYRSTVVEDPSAAMLPRKSISLEELQGGVAIPLAGDRAAAGRLIKEIEGTPMNVQLEGGPDFMRLHPGAAWASGQGVLTMLANRIKMARESGQPVYGVYTAMSPQAVDFNTMMTESLLNQMDVKDFKKKDIQDFNKAVKSIKGQGGKPKAPNFPGLEDPELREKLLSGPGGQRDAFVKAMAKAEFQKRGFPDVAAARLAVTEPELLDIERGSAGYTVAKLDPEAKIVEQSGHATYPLDILGDYVGGFEKQLPVEMMYPTHFEAKRLMGSKPEGAHKSLELFAPLQYLDQNWLDNAMKYLELQKKLTGRKKGGLATPLS